MHRQIISISKQQKTWLEAESKKLGLTLTEIIRRMIDKSRGAL